MHAIYSIYRKLKLIHILNIKIKYLIDFSRKINTYIKFYICIIFGMIHIFN